MPNEKIITILDIQNLRSDIANLFKKQADEINMRITSHQQIFVKTDVLMISDEHLLKISEFTGFKFKLKHIKPYAKKLTEFELRIELEFIYTDK